MNELLLKYKDYLEARQLSKNYFNVMSIFFSYCEKNNIDPLNITQETITNFINTNSQYTKNSLNQFIKAGSHMYREFLQLSDEKNEWSKLKYFKGHKTTPKFLNLNDLHEIISKFCTFENRLMNPFKTEVFIKFVYMTGLRKNEIITLKREAFTFSDNKIKIRIVGKGDKERFIYITEKYSPKLKQMVQDYFSSEPETINAFNMTKGKIDYFFRKMNKYLPDKKITPHLFRHSFSKYLVDKGVPLTYIQSLLGHSRIETTMIYLNPTDEQIEKFMEEK